MQGETEVELTQDGLGKKGSQSSATDTTDITEQNSPEGLSVTGSRPSKPKRSKQVTLLTSIDPRNIIDMTGEEDEQSMSYTPPTSSLPPSSYSLRNRRSTQGKLIYDAKYHPMDDNIRPSQAAKRRSLHGEFQFDSDSTMESDSLHEDTDEEEDDEGIEEPTKPTKSNKPTKKGKKRARSWSQSPQPTRRSSRKTSGPKISYNTNVHPQDPDLEISSADDSDYEVDSPVSQRQALLHSVEQSDAALSGTQMSTTVVSEIASKARSGSRELAGNQLYDHDGINTLIETSSPSSVVATPPPYGVRRSEGLNVWKLKPGERYFRHDRDSWPEARGLPFEIYTERLEDQLAAEAKAASPLYFEQDDKENDSLQSRFEEAFNPTEGVSVMQQSQYRPTVEENVATEALYRANGSIMPYGLGGGDGSHEQANPDTRDEFMSEAMAILASGDMLPGKASKERGEDSDSVQGRPMSSISDIDSVLG